MSIATVIFACAASAFVVYTVLFNVRGRRKERTIAKVRGFQNAAAFAEMFATDGERAIAQNLYPRLERLTFTGELPLLREDKLFPAAYGDAILTDEASFHTLDFDDEDLADEVIACLKELGCETPQKALTDELSGVKTLGQLVTALANLRSSWPAPH